MGSRKHVRICLTSWEIWTVYHLVDEEYWHRRRIGDVESDYFQKISELRLKLLETLRRFSGHPL